MILDQWILQIMVKAQGDDGFKLSTQPLRLLRLLKILRMARLMRAFPELITMVKGMARAARAISSSMILIFLITYVWSMVMHMLFSSEPRRLVAGICFLLFLLLTAMLLLQMLIGVLCEVVNMVDREQRDTQTVHFIREALLNDLKECDTQGD